MTVLLPPRTPLTRSSDPTMGRIPPGARGSLAGWDVLTACFPFVSHDLALNDTIILKGNLILSPETNKAPKQVGTILLHGYFYPGIK